MTLQQGDVVVGPDGLRWVMEERCRVQRSNKTSTVYVFKREGDGDHIRRRMTWAEMSRFFGGEGGAR